MKIAYITSQKPGEIDRLIEETAQKLLQQGKKITGIVKVMDYDARHDDGCDMKVKVLPTGPEIQITQSLGAGSGACRLDPAGIAEAVVQVEAAPLHDCDMFILNKFGPEEASGRGFCTAIGTALDHGVPVLLGVGSAAIADFDAFSGGLAKQLNADSASLQTWVAQAAL